MALSEDLSPRIKPVKGRRSSFETMLPDLGFSQQKGQEGDDILPLSWQGHKIGVFTSGGDSQGMNAAVRAIVRVGMYIGCKVFYIKEGYQGMVDGGNNIVEATWHSTSNIINVGGTMIGSARCMDFKERWGRLKAAANLIEHGITNLIAIGGDGSLTGTNLFREEWPSLLRQLVDEEIINGKTQAKHAHLNIVGLVGSIDNDFCGTDMTIGVDSALHRIIEAIDDIQTTAVSHKRAFVLEVMGRMCGYLPLAAGLASEASTIYIPEDPPKGDWKTLLCDQLIEKIQRGELRRTHLVLVAEGAIDYDGNIIKAGDVQKVLADRMKMDVRVTVLGHVQRGGNTSGFDRLLGTRMGTEAVMALVDAKHDTPAVVIAITGWDIVRVPLMESVKMTKMVGTKMAEKDYEEVIKLRGRPILHNLLVYQMQRQVVPHPSFKVKNKRIYRIAMVCVGKPCCGMNAVARGFVGVCVSKGYMPVFIYNGWPGLVDGMVKPVYWNNVHHYTSAGGSLLGTNTQTAGEAGLSDISEKLRQYQISGLIIVGGFEAFKSAYEMYRNRENYEGFVIPMSVIPASISNNIPGCQFSLGCDTAINTICKSCDQLKSSAASIQKCVCLVEVGGENYGCLATLAGLATGADAVFTREDNFTIRDVQRLCDNMKNKMKYSGVKQALILRHSNANPHITIDFLFKIFKEEGKHQFTTMKTVLGETQAGFVTSPYDRCAGIKAGCRATAWMVLTMNKCGAKTAGDIFTMHPETITVMTNRLGKLAFTPVRDLADETDFKLCIPTKHWWMKLKKLLEILSWPSEDIGDVAETDHRLDDLSLYGGSF